MKINGALGFCAKAGKLKSGEFAVDQAIKAKKAKLIVLDLTASDGTKKKWQDACDFYSVRLIIMDSPGKLMGKKDNMVFAVLDDNFASMIIEAFDSPDSGGEQQDTNI